MSKPRILILCTGNSCRSDMAEGALRAAAGDLVDVYSAGSQPAGFVHPKAVEVMSEVGIDLSAHTSKSLDQFLDAGIHTVITVCSNAEAACPFFPGQVARHHWGFEDPAHAEGTDDEVLAVFRDVRDRILMVFGAYAAGLKTELV